MPCYKIRSYQWELVIRQAVSLVYMAQMNQIHISWFAGVMTKRKWRYVFLKSIESFSFVIIICITHSWLKIVAILLLNNYYMYHIFLIGRPVHLFQTWLGELGVYKHQDGVLTQWAPHLRAQTTPWNSRENGCHSEHTDHCQNNLKF